MIAAHPARRPRAARDPRRADAAGAAAAARASSTRCGASSIRSRRSALWALNLYVWHLPFLYEAALRHDAVHALEHICFFTGGILMWTPVLETLPMPEWFGTGAKLGYVAVVRVVETVLGNVFIWPNSVFYSFYEHAARPFGMSAIDDQRLAGSVMMVEGSLVTIIALAWLFLRLAAEGEQRQRLLERGLDPRAVRRAVRYGRAQEFEQAR